MSCTARSASIAARTPPQASQDHSARPAPTRLGPAIRAGRGGASLGAKVAGEGSFDASSRLERANDNFDRLARITLPTSESPSPVQATAAELGKEAAPLGSNDDPKATERERKDAQ